MMIHQNEDHNTSYAKADIINMCITCALLVCKGDPLENFLPLFGAILRDHSEAVNAILLLVSGGLAFLYYLAVKHAKEERDELLEVFKKHIEADRTELIEVIERYQEGHINVVQALNEIRLLIATIGTKL